MKKIKSLILSLVITTSLLAQAPQKISYQTVIRDASNVLISGSTVGIQLSILQGSASGTALFIETHTPTTNLNGLASLEIGSGTSVLGTISGIDWSAGPYFIKTETDPLGGTVYTISGTSQLTSVPYALFSANGSPGATGATGIAGTNGANGIDGATGATGIAGTNGTNGIDGATGATGIAGTNGTNGTTGATGTAGTNGTNGTNGSAGATGATGTAGVNGTNGTNGATGATGTAGTNGTNGTNGATGSTGATGINGTNGADGATGATGTFSGTAWETIGNAGTTSAINFIGTTDNVSLIFKVNGSKAGLIDAPSANRFNTSLGYQTFNALVSGINNTALGYQTMNALATGMNNTALGYRALALNTSGSKNIAIGSFALSGNIMGEENVAIGLNALVASTVSGNLAIGTRALLSNTTGTPNLAIGSDALASNITGFNNVAVGNTSLFLNTASGNVAIGIASGNTNTSGANNTFIGYNADVATASLTNATAIGANSVVSASNSLVLGNAANVGIGTSNPIYAKLQVVGYSVFTATNTGFTAATRAAYIRGNDTYSTATTPDYTWYNSEQTGMFHPAASTVAFCANGVGETVRINAVGNMGIRTPTPNGLLELGLDQGRKPGTSTWTIVSDERLKNIEGAYTKGLKELMQLQTIVYHYKNSGGRKFHEEVLKTQNVGFSAQDVQRIFPEAVGVDEDGFLNLNLHSVFVAYLNAIKEQQLQIETLQAENEKIKAELRSEVNTLKKQNEEIIEKLNQLKDPINSISTKK